MEGAQMRTETPRASTTTTEETPLLIHDYSCANSFEDHVKLIEQYLAALFDREPLLQSFLVHPTPPPPPPLADAEQSATAAAAAGPTASSIPSAGSSASSLASLLVDDTADSDVAVASKVFGTTLQLYEPPPPSASADDAARPSSPRDQELTVSVEVHVRDGAHPITQQYCTPLFFLIRKVTASASYRDGETRYLLSLLATAVRQMLLQRHTLNGGSVLRLCPSAVAAVPGSRSPLQPQRRARNAILASHLPSPFFYPDGCAPCFAPAGDSYKQTFIGMAPPLPTSTAVPPLPPVASTAQPLISTAEWTLLHLRAFSTNFIADAFGRAPERSRTLSDFIDLFHLHVGQHSRIRSDDFDGICVSLWKAYVLPVPWKFCPYGGNSPDPGHGRDEKRRAAESSVAEAAASFTWDAVLRRENEYTRLLCGPFTHDFGTAAPPLKHVRFHFQWNQLQDVEAHEGAGRASHLDPFHYATAGTASAAAAAAQRKCCITAQAIQREEREMEHGVSERLETGLVRGYLDSLTAVAAVPSSTARSPRRRWADAATMGVAARLRGGSGSGSGRASTLETPADRADAEMESEHDDPGREGESDAEGRDGRRTEAELHELAACIVEWDGATVALQEALLCRFAAPSTQGAADHDDEDDEDSADARGGGSAGAADGGARVPPGEERRGAAVVARHLRSLWDRWSAHQRSTGTDGDGSGDASGALYGAHRVAAVQAKDLRASYFPDSLVARFAHVCAAEVPHPADVRVLWRRCVDVLRRLLQEAASWQRLLNSIALPAADPPVDMDRPLLTQKMQLLRYAVDQLLHGRRRAQDRVDSAEQPESGAVPAASGSAGLCLVTNGEPLCAPPPLPQPPTTTDAVLRRALELNALGAAAVEGASEAWLHTDALYNDMCLFLYVNKAQEGRVVRFPDFVRWHSPRDFVTPAPSGQRSDNDFLSERMQQQQQEQGLAEEDADGHMKGSTHVWWALWRRATPRSYRDIVDHLFQPMAQAAEVLAWMEAMPAAELLLEVCNASVANALHRLLCHRFVLGDVAAPSHRIAWHSPMGAAAPTQPDGGTATAVNTIPGTPRIPALHRYVRDKCTSLTKDVEAASSLFLSSRSTELGSALASSPSSLPPSAHQPPGTEAMLTEMLRSFFASALHQLGEIEVGVCTAVALQYLIGFSTDPEAAAVVHALGSPLTLSHQQNATSLQTRVVTVPMATWSAVLAVPFLRMTAPEPQESMVRLTCMAERPLNTGGCFQQMVVHQDPSHSMRMALALSKEVL